jgi:excisionase family DNA binding protein
VAEAIVQIRPASSLKGRPALHQTTTPATLPFRPLEHLGFCALLTVREVAVRFNVSRAAIYGLVKSGRLRVVRVSNAIRVQREDVDVLVS